jgi:hypothetical protein
MARRLVVTLPPGLDAPAARAFAESARARGAALLELRTDLHPEGTLDPAPLARCLDLLVSERIHPLPASWVAAARLVDREHQPPDGGAQASLISHHARQPLPPDQALALWSSRKLPEGALIKHVEPLGNPGSAGRLLETQRRLIQQHGPDRVTVLATGVLALPFRCVLARSNALEYLASTPEWMAVPGQRLLEDAVRELRHGRPDRPRLGILGSQIAHSRSPRIHRQPFDRIDLPGDAPIGWLVDALRPFYVGLAVTSPFKQAVAAHLGGRTGAVNTLVRRMDGWEGHNTDVDGASAVLKAMGAGEVTVLGAGGAQAALKLAAIRLGKGFRVLRRQQLVDERLDGGAVVWTWPPHVAPPEGLRLDGSRVAIIAYGPPARTIAREVVARGGTPLHLGPRWLIAQARRQRALWAAAGA